MFQIPFYEFGVGSYFKLLNSTEESASNVISCSYPDITQYVSSLITTNPTSTAITNVILNGKTAWIELQRNNQTLDIGAPT